MLLKYPKVSVVLSTYNRPEMLCEAVHSILTQTFTDFELVVVDDGSKTARVALDALFEKEGKPEQRVLIIDCEENSGYQAVPKNIGFNHAQGSYVAWADDDDLWDNDHLETLVTEIEKGEADLVYGRWRVSNTSGKGPQDGSEWPYIPFNFLTARLIYSMPQNNFISVMTLSSRAALVLFFGTEPWNIEMRRFGDWDLYCRMLQVGLRFRGVDKVTFTYRWHGENLQITRPPLMTPPIKVMQTALVQEAPR